MNNQHDPILNPDYAQFGLYHTDAQLSHKKIAFIGAGNMAHAMIRGILTQGYPTGLITVSAPTLHHSKQLKKQYGIQITQDNQQAIADAEVVVLAVKPQLMAKVCSSLQTTMLSNKLIISIAAGVTIARLHKLLPSAHHIIRTMPNTPAFINKGMTGIYAPPNLMISFKMFTQALMETMGQVCWVERESQMNTVIAAAGSAPAYFFYFMEAMQVAAIKQGITKEQARMLVQYAAIGAASMVQENSDIEIATLRHNVTSKGGTTAEAIAIFENARLSETIDIAMQAVHDRAIEMEQEY